MESEKYNVEDLRNEAPKLFGMEKKNPFEVPDNFFDTFSFNVQDKIAAQQKQSVWNLIFETIIKPKIAISVLASICLVAVGLKFMQKPLATHPAKVEITYSDLSKSDYLNDIDESLLTDALIAYSTATKSDAKTETDSYRIENYLIENNIDASDLESALN